MCDGKGTGLGLSVCRGLVESAGGSMWATSNPQGGAEFWIRIPTAGLGARADRVRVLVVDDDPVALKYLSSIIESADLYCTSDPAEALLLAEREHFDAVICDVFMPQMDGPAFHDQLAKVMPGLASRMTFMTGGQLNTGLETRLDKLGLRVMLKPLDAREVRAAVAEMSPRDAVHAG